MNPIAMEQEMGWFHIESKTAQIITHLFPTATTCHFKWAPHVDCNLPEDPWYKQPRDLHPFSNCLVSSPQTPDSASWSGDKLYGSPMSQLRYQTNFLRDTKFWKSEGCSWWPKGLCDLGGCSQWWLYSHGCSQESAEATRNSRRVN